MGLDLKYFKDQTHIKDLLKLKDDDLYFIIRLLQGELEAFNNKGFNKIKGIIRSCNDIFDLFKDLCFILNGYIDVIKENDLTFCDKEDIEDIINNMDSIADIITKIKTAKLSKDKLSDMVDTVILKLRSFYDLLSDYIYCESHLWEAVRCREERINKRERYMEQDKFNTQE